MAKACPSGTTPVVTSEVAKTIGPARTSSSVFLDVTSTPPVTSGIMSGLTRTAPQPPGARLVFLSFDMRGRDVPSIVRFRKNPHGHPRCVALWRLNSSRQSKPVILLPVLCRIGLCAGTGAPLLRELRSHRPPAASDGVSRMRETAQAGHVPVAPPLLARPKPFSTSARTCTRANRTRSRPTRPSPIH